MNPDCHFGDHSFHGTSQCVHCGYRLRCQACGCYVRADNEEHFNPDSPKLCREVRGITEPTKARRKEATDAK